MMLFKEIIGNKRRKVKINRDGIHYQWMCSRHNDKIFAWKY
nr:MAG TPA: hypothetical protein [Caudoviricetes sp.]